MCHICKSVGCIGKWCYIPQLGIGHKLRMASTLDPQDGHLQLSHGSCHYLNVHDDSGWVGTDESPQDIFAANVDPD